MGNNSSSLQSKTSSTNMGTSNDLINKLFEHNNVDSLNMTEFNTNKGGSSIPVIRVSHLPQIGGFVQPVANKYSNEFINNMNKNRIFNLIHDTEIQEYHVNNMIKQGILNNNATATTNTMTGGYVPPTNATNVNESDVSDAMNRIKEVIVNELKEQELKGGANNNSDSNTDGCGCGGNDDGKKHSNKCEYGKKKKSKKSNAKSYKSSSSSSSSDDEDGAINSNNGLSIFPFNSSDVSDKNYRLQRRKK